MDSPTPSYQSLETSANTTIQSDNNSNGWIIILLSVLLIFSFLGINLLNLAGNWLAAATSILAPAVQDITSAFARASGHIIINTADTTADVARFGINVADDTVGSVGKLLVSAGDERPNLNATINSGANAKNKIPEPSSSDSSIQKPVSSAKTSWCLAGEFQGKRGCIEVADANKCISGQLFPSQQICLNPTMSPYR